MVTRGVLYSVVCGAGPARHVDRLVTQARARGWTVHVIATATACEHFLDVPALERLLGAPVRTSYTSRGERRTPPDAVIVAPATYNTINKWAAGISDTYVLSLLAEQTGLHAPIAVLPFVNTALAANRVFDRSLAELRAAGVIVLFGPDILVPHPPRTADTRLESYPWHLALDAIER
jgi:phosphopantothenoylcysteine synthetase/decarboxylase